MKKYMDLRKWNKTKLLNRLIAFPFKLVFKILWGVVSSILYSFKWLKNGSQELVYGDEHSASLSKILKANEELIETLKQ